MFQLGDALTQPLLFVVLHLCLKALHFTAGLVGLATNFLFRVARLLVHDFTGFPSLFEEVNKDVALAEANSRLRIANRLKDFAMSANVGEVARVHILLKLAELKAKEVLGAVNLTRKLAACALNRTCDRVTCPFGSGDTVEDALAVIVAAVVSVMASVVALAGGNGCNRGKRNAVVIFATVAEAKAAKARANAGTDEAVWVVSNGHISVFGFTGVRVIAHGRRRV